MPPKERAYTTLLMATGLTFGSIAALYGLTHGYIDRSQYTELVTVVILSAFVPTIIAQQVFQPKALDTEEEEALGAEDVSVIHRPHPGIPILSPAHEDPIGPEIGASTRLNGRRDSAVDRT